MAKGNKNDFAHFPETAMWRSLMPINTPVVDPHNGFAGARESTVPDESYIQVTVKHDFSETFEREKFNG